MEGICNSGSMCDIKECEKLLLEQYALQWVQQIKHYPKLRTYCDIKDNFYTEHYVKINKISEVYTCSDA